MDILHLQTGDEIQIVAPASAVEKKYVGETVRILSDFGYKTSLGKHIYAADNQFAGTDVQRKADVQEALNDPAVRAILFARGGYGSIRFISSLDFSVFRKNPKWIAGFSDVTVFHCLLNETYGIRSIHSPMPVNAGSTFFEENLRQLDSLLRGKLCEIHFEPNPLNRFGSSKGILVGGNLSIIYSLQSTPYEIHTENKILFIEDVGEQLYHLDRMLHNLKLSGKFNNLQGLVVGGMTAMEDTKRPFGKTAYEIVAEISEKYNFPVAFGFPAGHIENNVPFVLGAEAELLVNNQGSCIRYE